MKQLAEGLYALTQDKGGHVHAYLVDDGNGLTLFDTLYDDDANVVLAALAELGKTPAQLTSIVLTHAHKSHLGGLAALKKATGATVYSHEWEEPIIAGRREAQRVSIWPKKPLEVYYLQLGLALGKGKHVPCVVDRPLKEGDRVGPLEVVASPGHTPGSLSFHWRERKTLIVGDVIVTWPRLEAGWQGLTLDQKENLRSIAKLSEASDVEIVCSGHGGAVEQDGARVLRALAEGRDAHPG